MATMEEAVQAALDADTVEDVDQGTAALALAYARGIDHCGRTADVLNDLGPKLLAALEALQLSPRARTLARIHRLNTGGPGVPAQPDRSHLDELRAARERKRGSSAMDATAPRS